MSDKQDAIYVDDLYDENVALRAENERWKEAGDEWVERKRVLTQERDVAMQYHQDMSAKNEQLTQGWRQEIHAKALLAAENERLRAELQHSRESTGKLINHAVDDLKKSEAENERLRNLLAQRHGGADRTGADTLASPLRFDAGARAQTGRGSTDAVTLKSCFVCAGLFYEHARLSPDLRFLAKGVCVSCEVWVKAQSVVGRRTLNSLWRSRRWSSVTEAQREPDARLLREKNVGPKSIEWLRTLQVPTSEQTYLNELADTGVLPV